MATNGRGSGEPRNVNERALTSSAAELFATFAPQIAALPAAERLTREQLQVPEFLLHQAGRLAIYYAPFDYVNPQARVVLVGITPGFRQMEIALRASRDALLAGDTDYAAICARVKYQASFAGPIRRFLLTILDGIGIPQALGIPASASLYAERSDLLQTSAVVRHPVFINGADWTGIPHRYVAIPSCVGISGKSCCQNYARCRRRSSSRSANAPPMRSTPSSPPTRSIPHAV